MKNPLIFSTLSYSYLLESLCKLGNYETGIVERKFFPDGESYHRIVSEVNDRNVFLLGVCRT